VYIYGQYVKNFLSKKNILEIFTLLLIASSSQVASDLYTPSLPSIAAYFRTDIGAAEMTIAIYMAALTLTQLIWGPLSDHFGRKRILGIGLITAIIGSLICATVFDLYFFFLGRLLQGIGNGAAAGLWRAIFRDRYTGERLARVSSYFGNLLVLILISAPLLGGVLQETLGWRANFTFLVIWGGVSLLVLLLFIRESKQKTHQRPCWRRNYGRLLKSPVFMGCCLCNFLTYAGKFAWITVGSPLIVGQMGMTPLQFGTWSATAGLFMIIGAALNGYYVLKLGITRMLSIGWSMAITSGSALLIAPQFLPATPFLVFTCLAVFLCGLSFVFANTFATALAPFGDIAGSASGLYTFIQMAGGASSSFLLSLLGEAGTNTLGFFFLTAGGGSWLIFAFVVHKSLRRRRVTNVIAPPA
jgi:Bcr/CflA subfamily drug resistance transporter